MKKISVFHQKWFRGGGQPPRAVEASGQPVVLITGASQGLGRAFGEAWARRGAALLLAALPGSGLPQAAEELRRRFGVPVEYLEVDLTAPGSLERLAEWIAETGRPVSVLINNAGVGYNSRFEDSTVQENEACILLNNLALVKITRLLLPNLKRQPRAYLLNVSSLAAFFPMPFMPVYAPSKAFILNFSLALREEMRGSSVTVSALCPNGILTNAETRRQIAAGGWAARLTCHEASVVAEYAIERLLAGSAVIVPGWLNRVIMTAGKYTPRPVIYGVIGAFWGKTARPPA